MDGGKSKDFAKYRDQDPRQDGRHKYSEEAGDKQDSHLPHQSISVTSPPNLPARRAQRYLNGVINFTIAARAATVSLMPFRLSCIDTYIARGDRLSGYLHGDGH